MKPTDNTTSCTRRIMQTLAVCAGVLIVGACSTTKRIPEGEQLYTGIKKIDITAPEGDKVPEGVAGQITEAVGVPPNNAIFKSPKYRWPFPVGLWVYNNWDDPGKGIKHWLYDKLVSEPVLVSDVRPQIRTRMVDEILDNNGYFRGNATYETIDQKDPKKAKISYTIKTGPAYTLDSIGFLPDTCLLNHLIDSIAMRDPYLRAGERYSTDSLSAVRTRITNKLRNRGFYFFRPDYIEYLADSINQPFKIDLRMMLANNIPAPMLARYTTGDITVYAFRNQGGGTPDTIHTSRGTLIQMKPSRLRHQLIPECVTFRKGKVFAVRDMNRTQTRLARLGIFNAINIDVVPDSARNDRKLNVIVNCTFDTPLEATVELNASSKSNSYIGPGILLGLTNRNRASNSTSPLQAITNGRQARANHRCSTPMNWGYRPLLQCLGYSRPALSSAETATSTGRVSLWISTSLTARTISRWRSSISRSTTTGSRRATPPIPSHHSN